MKNQNLTTTKEGSVISQQNIYNKFVKIWSPEKVKEKNAVIKTLDQVIHVKAPSIGMVCNEFEIKKTRAYIKLWIVDLLLSLNLKRTLNEFQIDEVSLLICTEYRSLTVADINLIFKDAKLGKYGEFYESIDVAKIMKWFADYSTNRMEAFERKNYNQHIQEKGGRNTEKALPTLDSLSKKMGGMSSGINSIKSKLN